METNEELVVGMQQRIEDLEKLAEFVYKTSKIILEKGQCPFETENLAKVLISAYWEVNNG